MSNKGLLAVVVVILLGLFAVVVINVGHRNGPGEEISRSFVEKEAGSKDASHTDAS